MTAVYIGALARETVYIGALTDTAIYFGMAVLFPSPATLNFVTGAYSADGVDYDLAHMPGWSYSRSGSSAYAMNSVGVPVLFAANVARITDLGMLNEVASTNMVRYSNNGVNAMSGYTPSREFNLIASGKADPIGGTGAVLFTGNGTFNTHGCKWWYDASISYANATTYTFSAFVKPGSTNICQLTGPSGPFGTAQRANFTLTGSGTVNVQSGGTATITQYGAWYRITWTVTSTAAAIDHSGSINLCVTNADNRNPVSSSTDTLTIWGWQVEAAGSASSLIVTGAAAAARGADVCALTYIGTASVIRMTYTGGVATPAVASPVNIGASSGGAWVGKYLKQIDILYAGAEAPLDPLRGGWNTTALQAASMTFSNNNRTVVGNNNGGFDNRVYSLASATTGKKFASIRIDNSEFQDVSVTDDTDTNYVHYTYEGTVYSSTGVVLGNIDGYVAPCDIDISMNLDASLVWFRVNGGYWNSNPAANPETDVGGYALPRGGACHVKAQMPYFPTSQRTLNTGTVPFTFPPSASYVALAA